MIILFIMMICLSIVESLLIYEIIIENFNVHILGILFIHIYDVAFYVGIGYLFIRNQRRIL